MYWNYRVIKKKLNEEEDTFDVCEVYYDEKGNPTSYAVDKNVLSQDSYNDLLSCFNEIKKAYKSPVLEYFEDRLVELKTCPKCGNDINYDVMDIMGDGEEEDFGKTTLVCSTPNGCGYVAIRQD